MATRLAHVLESRGHTVTLVSASPPPAPERELASVRLDSLDGTERGRWTTVIEPVWDEWRFAALERSVESAVLRDRVEVVHYHYAWPFAHLVWRLRVRLGANAPAFVGTLHGTDVTKPPSRAGLAALRDTDVFTTVSHSYARLARAELDLSVEPAVIPNFVDPRDFPRSVDFEDAGRRPRLVHVSNFRPVKDPEGVARIFLAVREQLDVELWLVGVGPGLAELEAAVTSAGAGDAVHVLGYRADVGRTLAECDLLLMTSLEESFCLAALEALAGGLCVVATAVGGVPELVEHGRTAMLFEPGDYRGGAELVLRLLRDRELRLRMRAAAAERARAFTPDPAVRLYEELYESAVGVCRPERSKVAGGVA